MPTHLTVLGLWPAAPHPRFGRGARPASGSLSRPSSRCTPGLRAGCSRGLERSSPVFSPGRLLLVMTRTFLSPGALSGRVADCCRRPAPRNTRGAVPGVAPARHICWRYRRDGHSRHGGRGQSNSPNPIPPCVRNPSRVHRRPARTRT